MADQLGADGEVIAEAAEAEPLAQAGLLNLDPADGLQVAGGHAQQRALRARWPAARLPRPASGAGPSRAALLGNAVAHGLQNGLHALFQHLGGNPRLPAGLAQNGGVRAAVKQECRPA
jgi:hypothetical protein